MKIKKMLTLAMIVMCAGVINAQSLKKCQQAVEYSSKGVQAIHHYPENINEGKCHFVEVTSIEVNGSNVKIVETWTIYGVTLTTTLTGSLTNELIEGTWKSETGSAGDWKYNFRTDMGKWNKASSRAGIFTNWEELEFDILLKKDLLDGFYECK